MKLRVARKMDQPPAHVAPNRRRDKRPWWAAYRGDQLERAERRLRQAWRAHCPRYQNAEGAWVRRLTPDFFAANRVNARRVRQGARKRLRRAGRLTP